MLIPSYSFARHETLEEYDAHLNLPADFRNTFTADLNSSFHTEYGFTGNAITHHSEFCLVATIPGARELM